MLHLWRCFEHEQQKQKFHKRLTEAQSYVLCFFYLSGFVVIIPMKGAAAVCVWGYFPIEK